MLDIQFRPIAFNHNKDKNNPKYIVIHDTANPTGTALDHHKYFGKQNRNASAHYFVDNENIVQIIKDTDSSWHCGDGKGKYGISNHNSIGIEICLPEDIDASISNAMDLAAHLMEKYSIPIDHVVRHYDASRKICPAIMSKNNWAIWNDFKKNLKGHRGYVVNNNSKDTLYHVQVGAYTKRANAENMVRRLKSQGFEAIIKGNL